MERLTIRNSDGSVSQPLDLRWAEALEKLAAYEDTGLTPEEITEQQMMLDMYGGEYGITEIFKERNSLKALAQAKTLGRLIILPFLGGEA